MFERIRYDIKSAARRSALSVLGIIFVLIGLAFLTTAAWIALTISADTLTAALVIGGVYTGLGLLILAGATMSRRRVPYTAVDPLAAPASSPSVPYPGLAQAFMQGFGAGATMRRSPSPQTRL